LIKNRTVFAVDIHDPQKNRQEDQRNQRKLDIQEEHCDIDADDQENALNETDQNGDEHFLDRFCIVGHARNDSAGRSLVKIAHAEALYFGEHINPHLLDDLQCGFLEFQQLEIDDDDV